MRETCDGGIEDALADWYRIAVRRQGTTRDPAGTEAIVAQVEASLARGDLPSTDLRRALDRLTRAEALDHLSSEVPHHGPVALRVRRALRRLLGSRPHRTDHRGDAPPTRVLHAIVDLRIGGAQQLVVDLARTPRDRRDHLTIALQARLRFQPSIRYRETTPSRADIERAFDTAAPDVVHVCHYHSNLLTRAWYELVFDIALERRLPIVQSHCVIGDPWLGSTDQHLVFCSAWSRDRSGVEDVPSSVIFPGTPIEVFRRTRRPVSSSPRIGMIYRLDGDKIDPASGEVIARILETIPTATMTVVGDGSVRAPMHELLEKRGLLDRVAWLGFVPFERLPALYESFDVVIAPVRADTFGSGSVHAICGGTPVIGYDVAAIPSILRHEAAIVPYGDAETFARRVQDLLDDDLHREVHQAQMGHAERHFDLATMCRRYHDLFARVARGPIQRDVA